MRHFHVYLTGQGTAASGLLQRALSPAQRSAIHRQYRSYLPGTQWLPEAPVHVWLTGPNGKVLPRAIEDGNDFELSLVSRSSEQPRLKKLFVAAAAAAAVIMPMSAQSAGAEGRGSQKTAPPPSVHDRQESPTYDCGPPTASLRVTPRATDHHLQPLIAPDGRPVELGAFHSNAVTHTNAITAHTNNALVPHNNVWQNHSNIPSYSIPHTNVVPGDFIF